ncbi:unnamed protein product [Heligmosomoides polygyrus]|uniref:Reverse transcriptase n=1 Tax=Heligmosomoides polygyrus TaxID=6339 RepID=A0A183F743_HELPZ|nr:unnamed protein product [Heligmosomoides polygyrus]
METKMLRWTAGVMRLYQVHNDSIRQSFGVTPIFEKMREARLRWYGHALRANNDTVRMNGLNLMCTSTSLQVGYSNMPIAENVALMAERNTDPEMIDAIVKKLPDELSQVSVKALENIFMSNPIFIPATLSSFSISSTSARAGRDENNIVGEAKVADPFTVDEVAFIVPIEMRTISSAKRRLLIRLPSTR